MSALKFSEFQVQIADIRIDGGTQSRASINPQIVSDYAEAIKAGDVFPPVVVFFDGADYWLADGFHRYEAHASAGSDALRVDLRQGTRRDAVLFSVGANALHGLRRTNDDKRRAVLTLLNDAEWGAQTDQWIATQCGVGRLYVGRLRSEGILPSDSKMNVEPVTRVVTRNGKTFEMNVAKIGSGRPKQRPLLDEEIALLSGCSKESVYLLSTGERVKIGWSRYPKNRIENILTSNPEAKLVGIAAGGRKQEQAVHARLDCERDAGEWFVCSADQAIDAMCEVGLKPFVAESSPIARPQVELRIVETPAVEEPEVSPQPIDAERRKLAKLTPDALIDEVLGLRADLAEAKAKVKKQDAEIKTLKDLVKSFEGDQAEVIRNQANVIRHKEAEMYRANDTADRALAKAKRLEKRVAELEKMGIEV